MATPIGNLEDVTLRALRVLREADLVFAEDTRRTRTLLDHHGVVARARSLHAHNEAARTEQALAALSRGECVALVSDAGTPLVSDPGERLVAAALEAGHPVVPVPGPSAVLAALVASGLPAVPFHFEGFLPRRSGERRARITELATRRETLVGFESPRRIGATLAELAEAFGERPAAVSREISKVHEETRRGSLGELARHFADGARGEITFVVAGASDPQAPDTETLDRLVSVLVATGSGPREIADLLAPVLGLPRRIVYARAVALREQKS